MRTATILRRAHLANREVLLIRASAPALAAVAMLPSGCGSSSSGGSDSGPTPPTVKVVLTPGGCPPRPAVIPAGKVTVHIVNRNADAVSTAELRTGGLTRVVGEVENILPGISGSFTVSLDPGSYVFFCDGATRPESLLTVRARTKS